MNDDPHPTALCLKWLYLLYFVSGHSHLAVQGLNPGYATSSRVCRLPFHLCRLPSPCVWAHFPLEWTVFPFVCGLLTWVPAPLAGCTKKKKKYKTWPGVYVKGREPRTVSAHEKSKSPFHSSKDNVAFHSVMNTSFSLLCKEILSLPWEMIERNPIFLPAFITS